MGVSEAPGDGSESSWAGLSPLSYTRALLECPFTRAWCLQARILLSHRRSSELLVQSVNKGKMKHLPGVSLGSWPHLESLKAFLSSM